jgi:hypothetical protein
MPDLPPGWVTIDHPSTVGTADVTQEAFDDVWSALGWVIVATPVDDDLALGTVRGRWALVEADLITLDPVLGLREVAYAIDTNTFWIGDGVTALSVLAPFAGGGGAGVQFTTTTTAAMDFVLDEDNFASNSATKLATQQSIKAYVDNRALLWIDEDDMASNSATRVPTQQSVKAYVDTAVAGGGGGGVTLIDEDDMISNDATKAPSQQSVKAYVDNQPTLASSDTAVIDIVTVPGSGVTVLDVSGITTLIGTVSGSFADTVFDVHDSIDVTKVARFDATLIGTGITRNYLFPTEPDSRLSTTLVTEQASQDLSNKTLTSPLMEGVAFTSFPRVDGVLMMGQGWVNALEADSGLNIHGMPLVAPMVTFYHSGGTSSSRAQSTSGALIARIEARPTLDTTNRSTTATAYIRYQLDEAPTATSRGTSVLIGNTALGTGTVQTALKVTTGASQDVVSRGPIVAGAGSGLAAARTGLGLDILSGGLAVGTGTYVLPNADVNDLAVPACGMLVLDGTAMTAARTITGLTGGWDGRVLIIKMKNGTSPFDVIFAHDNAGSVAGNRIYSTNALALTITAANGGIAMFVYDGIDQRWFPIALRA